MRPVLIHEAERELIFCSSDEALVEHLKDNDPTLVGYVDLDSEDESALTEFMINNPEARYISLDEGGVEIWNKYAELLGLEKFVQ